MHNLRLLQRLCHIIKPNAAVVPQRWLASTHKRRPQLNTVPADQLAQLKATYFEQDKILTPQQWQLAQQTLMDSYKHINAHNIDATILGLCSEPQQLPLAKNYIHYLTTQGIKPNAATLGRLLRIYNNVYNTRPLCASEQLEILDICKTLQGAHETLDASSCENLILGLVATDTPHWQQAMPLLEMMKLTSTPTVAAYSALVAKAFNAADTLLAWNLMEEMLQAQKQPKCEVYLTYLEQIAKDPLTLAAALQRLLQFVERHEIIISLKVANKLQSLAKQLPGQLSVMATSLDSIGKCANCKQHLQHVAISETQFEELRNSFLNKVLIGNDVFQRSTPEEVAAFKQFIEKTAPYDCVIDGLNVAYSTGVKKSPQQLAQLVAAVVKYFKERRKRVLVLGRKHMKSWSKPAMHYIHNNASVFLTNNLSQDDPFLLYATLKSGQETDFFSRDLMRSHAFLLGAELKPIFRRWQQQHQYSLLTQTHTGKIIVKEPMRYRLCAHESSIDCWHVPYYDSYMPHQPDTFEVPDKWLCIKCC